MNIFDYFRWFYEGAEVYERSIWPTDLFKSNANMGHD